MYVQKSYYLEYAIPVYFCKISPLYFLPAGFDVGFIG